MFCNCNFNPIYCKYSVFLIYVERLLFLIFIYRKHGRHCVFRKSSIRKCVFPQREEPIGLIFAPDIAVAYQYDTKTIVKMQGGIQVVIETKIKIDTFSDFSALIFSPYLSLFSFCLHNLHNCMHNYWFVAVFSSSILMVLLFFLYMFKNLCIP